MAQRRRRLFLSSLFPFIFISSFIFSPLPGSLQPGKGLRDWTCRIKHKS